LGWAKRCVADEILDVSSTTTEERLERVRELTAGRGADVVLHMANTPKSFVEGIEMLKRGGMMLEMGNFADTGEISINVHRHICSKNIRLLGLTNHPSTGYGPALRLLERYADRYPFEEIVTHEFGLEDVETAMRTSMNVESMKVAIVPDLGKGRTD
jgi:threonine dehydrogenase-like Zn-dependent dehydrogenase